MFMTYDTPLKILNFYTPTTIVVNKFGDTTTVVDICAINV